MVKKAIDLAQWVHCPFCNKKIMKAFPDSRAHNFLVYCRGCKRELIVNGQNGLFQFEERRI